MGKEQLREFAETPHKGLPEKKKVKVRQTPTGKITTKKIRRKK
ncbi:unnamed protein product [marine sediment metagenome]|uniref:Uncharacterized protein n=1 Tax=marine sediment metagenome TaxID=412755 RepID=X1DAG1_9ZZZZ